ncbi:hypothetical protein ACTID9_16255 [Brevibacillus fluminis]|uniref:TolB family protein n=1 Tax=Brevibacillus fluminis TaxID=511487 RepID=UPI003F8A8BB8
MRFDDHVQADEQLDPTISQLLTHLKRLRKTVPVNYELKEDLRRKLLERMQQMEMQTAGAVMPRRRRRVWWITGGLFALALACVLWFGTNDTARYLAEELVLPADVSAVSVSASGEHVAWVTQSGALSVLPGKEAAQDQHIVTLKLPSTSGTYQSLAYANNDEQMAAIELASDASRIWLVTIKKDTAQASSRLLFEMKNRGLAGLSWSPDNLMVAFTRMERGLDEIWLASTIASDVKKLTEGSQPAWSPDGKRISFVDGDSVSVMDMMSGSIQRLAKGRFPSWQSADRLTFTTNEGTLAEYELEAGTLKETKSHIYLPEAYRTGLVSTTWTQNGKYGIVQKHVGAQAQTALLVKK